VPTFVKIEGIRNQTSRPSPLAPRAERRPSQASISPAAAADADAAAPENDFGDVDVVASCGRYGSDAMETPIVIEKIDSRTIAPSCSATYSLVGLRLLRSVVVAGLRLFSLDTLLGCAIALQKTPTHLERFRTYNPKAACWTENSLARSALYFRREAKRALWVDCQRHL